MNNIYLVGFMGTGKTTVGKELAQKLKVQFLDLDDLIELREKRAIADIFAKEGEQYFRCIESQVLKEVSGQKERFIVASGGGIVIRQENIVLMKESGVMVCLNASPEIILKRTSAYTHRPLLNVPNPKEKIESLLQARSKFYAQADFVIDTTKLSVNEVVDGIVKNLNLK